ncbi:restriction endonuclease subunit S, partial [Helicobacter ailurogastricus]|uniref:restriction endonuclease subunit S n=1 Tax=Helicobacter ailurogastricus TaxID=1578720 RepID=UPI0009E6B00A
GGGGGVSLDSFKWREFKIKDIFEVAMSKKIFHANTLNIEENPKEGFYPYVVRSARNNGIRGFIQEQEVYLNPGNTLSFAMDTFSVFYQETPYFTGNKIKVLIPKFGMTRWSALFIAVCCQKAFKTFTWGMNATHQDVENFKIPLPVIQDQITYEYMEHFIKALEKQHIERVKVLCDQRLKAYEEVLRA